MKFLTYVLERKILMEDRNLEKALDIVSVLITGQPIRENDVNDMLYQEYNNNAQVYDIVNMSLKKMNLNIYEYNNGLYISVKENNNVFGYSNEELRQELGVKVNKDLYMAYYAVSENEEIVADRDVEIPGMEEQANLYDVEHQIMDNAASEQIYTGENGIVDDVEADIPIAANNVESIADSLSEYGVYEDIDIAVKADIFGFDIANVSGNIRLFSDVIKRLGIKLDGDEIYEEFQRIYNKSVSMDADKGKMEDRMWDIGRGK